MKVKPFLWQVAKALVEKFGDEIYRIAVVFPNRRQSVYFGAHLQQFLTAPALLPELLTIEELVIHSSPYALANPIRQSIALYNAYLKVSKKSNISAEPMSFEDFYRLAQVLLNDLEETDANCVATNNIFSLIADYKEIDGRFGELTEEQRTFLRSFWNSVNLKDSYQQKFAELWRLIPQWYNQMHEELLKDGYTTLGQMYRQLANNSTTLPDSAWKHVAFVGFNAFNGAQERFIKNWQEAGLASLWLDADIFYTENPLHEAGYFFRRNLNKLGLKNEMPAEQFIPKKGVSVESKKQVDITRVDGQVAQAKVVSTWVNTLPDELPPGKAAILLADEKLLVPVLQSLPKKVKHMNITMGYPLSQSPLYSLLNLFFEVQQAVESKKASNAYISWEMAMQWLNHPLNDWEVGRAEKLKEKIIAQGIQWIKLENFWKQGRIGNFLFTPMLQHSNLFIWLRNLLHEVAKTPGANGDTLLQGLLSYLFNTLVSMETLYKDFLQNTTLPFLKSIVMAPLAAVSVPFEAESTAGIQVMGLLESRGLDFEYILLLGAGEGTLPRVAAAKTFIPYNLRKAYGLSTLEHQDAIFAYVFYRLLHRCSHLHAVYNGLVTDNSIGEISRFLKQLEHESGLTMQYHNLQLPVKATASNEITIEKNRIILQTLRRYYAIEKPLAFSPSAINKYLSCRLQFFLHYIAGIKKPDEMQTEIDAAVFGTVVHSLLQQLYTRWKETNSDAEITEEAINSMLSWIPEHLEKAIQDTWHKQEATTNNLSLKGFAAVVSDVVKHITSSFLEIDRGRVPFTVHHTEVSFDYSVRVDTVDGIKMIKLKGNIDRVDEKDGIVRIVDYKTGGDKIDFDSLAQLFETHGEKQNKGALQTLLYALMFSKTHPQYAVFEPALVVLRGINKTGNNSVRLFEKSTKTEISSAVMEHYLLEVEAGVTGILKEIFNPEVAFDQTADLRVCGYCDFKAICGR